MDHLATAAHALAEPVTLADRARALDHLIRAWRELGRPPEIAALVEALGREAARAFAPIDRELGDMDYHAAWIARAAGASALELDRLTPGLFRGPLGKRIRERFDLLVPFADDPRVSAAFGRMIAEPPVMAASNFPLWTQLFAALRRAPDVRLRPILEDRLRSVGGSSQFWPMLHQRCLELLRKLPAEAPPLDAGQREQAATLRERIDELAAAAPAKADELDDADALEAELLARIYAEPEVLEHRMVWADAVLSRGDPRGEFVQLQLARRDTGAAPSKRERKLLSTHSLAWIGELGAAVEHESLRYADGFPVAAEVLFDSATERAALDSPAWATFRELDCDDPELFMRPGLSALRRAGGFGFAALRRLVEHEAASPAGAPSPIEVLGPIIVDQLPPFELDHLRAAEATWLANVRELWLHLDAHELPRQPDDYAWLFETPLGQRLRVFRLSSFPYMSHDARMPTWDEWIDVLDQRPAWAGLERLRLDMHALSVEFERARGRKLLRVHASQGGKLGDYHLREAETVLRLLRGRFDAAEFVGHAHTPIADETLACFTEALDIHDLTRVHAPLPVPGIGFENWRKIRNLIARQERSAKRLSRSRKQASGEVAKPRARAKNKTKIRRAAVKAAEEAARYVLGQEAGRINMVRSAWLEFDGDARLWAVGGVLAELDVPTLDLRWTLGPERASFTSAAFDRTRRRAWLGTYRGETLLWDLDARRELGRGRFHRTNVCAVAVSEPRGLLLSTDRDRRLDTWRLGETRADTEQAVMIPLASHTMPDHLTALAVSPDGDTLALLGARGQVSLCNLDELARDNPRALAIGRVGARNSVLAWAPGGDHLVAARGDGGLAVWDPDGVELTRLKLHEQRVTALAWTPDGALVTASDLVVVTAPESGQTLLRIEPGAGTIRAVAVSPDGSALAIGAWDGVSCWSLANGRVLGRNAREKT